MEWRELSRLPDAPEYWQNLGERIQQAAHPLIGAQELINARAAWSVAGITAAIGAFALLIGPNQRTETFASQLTPPDAVAARLLASQQPPAIAELLR